MKSRATREIVTEFEEAGIEEEANDSPDLVVGSTDAVLYEHEAANEDADSNSESLSGLDIDDFEVTNGISSLMVNRYDSTCDHNEKMFSVGMRFESHEQFKNAVKRAIWKALSDIRGPIEEQYVMLRSYLAELKRVSKEGTFFIEVNPTTKVFEKFYVGFNELKKGFLAGCMRVIGLDGCFLKTGMKGMLLCAVGRDGNNQMFPIAWAVVEVESEASWTWFLTLLFIDPSMGTGEGWTFISDQQKGLMNAVSCLSPQAEYRNCARHIYANWKKLHKGDALKNLFWRAVRCTFQAEFDLEMANLKEECPKGYEDFMRQGPKHFCKAFIKTGTKCDAVDNNLSETFNGYLCIPRTKPILKMLEEIRTMLMDRMAKRSQLMMDRIDPICPRIRMKLEKTKLESKCCTARAAMGNNFEVQVFDNRFVVDLARKTCACREWDLSGIPCKHAICCISFMKFDINDYVDDCFKKDAYEKCYQYFLPAMNGQQMWPKAKIGRPKKATGVRDGTRGSKPSNRDSAIIRNERAQA
ncbi:uncharacterized protein LOC115725873 [Rhodamnia argentea]|uniref:Uncharacterized protein LOC115725873 n=1 Tax=Rhodamnia argentea TaxID=178133 RepID=A0ABM3HAU4_9MYRT|nr:uncharacterized protein LOC115725873 [Rhodamnia argentea]